MAEEQQVREEVPNVIGLDDLVNQIGNLSVDILNKSKVITQLWETIDKLLEKEAEVGVKLVDKEGQLEQLTQQKDELQVKVDNNAQKIEEKRLEFQNELNSLQKDKNKSDSQVSSLEKEIQGIEGKAVIDQEKFRQVAQGEVVVLEKKLKDLQAKLDKATVQPMAKRAGYKKKRKALDG